MESGNRNYGPKTGGSFAVKVLTLIKSSGFGFFSTLLLVFLLLVFKGSSGEGQASFFKNVIREYIEETSATVLVSAESSSQLADISMLTAINNDQLGQGGQENEIDPETINDNSLVASNPATMDYSGLSGLKRSQITEYTVQPGDLLSFIASDYGVSVSSIIWANSLRNADSISPDQVLKIPPVSGVVHEIVKGDTVGSIAIKYGGEESTIIEFNSLPQSGDLQIGREIIVPNGQIKSTAVALSTISRSFSYLQDLGNYFMPPTTGYNWGKIHGRNGVDVANSCGTPIYAAADGNVVISDASGWNGGFGQYIKIVHSNGTETLYAHASKLLISQGEYVGKGQLIALIGTTGRSTGCHLHFEVHGARNLFAH